ncbi:protein of unknown function [Candidatus Nitrospira inopinata]|uniref:Uncharacterized protein n=1 Tax=Candidatus Nitrospira inopinata TaxID=1715989 RepID=A0A0S4KW17_9BACT|nr:protein of unknown function [Candidatus Nitrospira inopinata]
MAGVKNHDPLRTILVKLPRYRIGKDFEVERGEEERNGEGVTDWEPARQRRPHQARFQAVPTRRVGAGRVATIRRNS